MTNKKITVQMLEALDACKPQVGLFKEFCEEHGFSEGVEVNLENLKKADGYGLDIRWAALRDLIPVDIIMDSGDIKYAYRCLMYDKDLSKEQFNKWVNIVIESGDKYYAYCCLVNIKGLSVEQKKALQANIKQGGGITCPNIILLLKNTTQIRNLNVSSEL